MKITFQILRTINIVGLLFLFLGPYGLPVTGLLQVISALLFIILFPKNKLIYIYFALVGLFFFILNIVDHSYTIWVFALPLFLIVFLTYTIYNQKITS
mgnify:CR=1 FL=1